MELCRLLLASSFPMFLNTTVDPRDHNIPFSTMRQSTGSVLRGGDINPIEAVQKTEVYLVHAVQMPSELLLNDNFQLRGHGLAGASLGGPRRPA
jgi:hypothetical protein